VFAPQDGKKRPPFTTTSKQSARSTKNMEDYTHFHRLFMAVFQSNFSLSERRNFATPFGGKIISSLVLLLWLFMLHLALGVVFWQSSSSSNCFFIVFPFLPFSLSLILDAGYAIRMGIYWHIQRLLPACKKRAALLLVC